MESTFMARQHATLAKPDLFPVPHTSPSRPKRRSGRVSLPSPNRLLSISVKSVRSEIIGVDGRGVKEDKESARPGPVPIFVGLPLDSVSNSNKPNHARAISAGLRALKLLGADGVELPVWWSAVYSSPGRSTAPDWSAYLSLARTVRDAGLRLRVSLNPYGPGRNVGTARFGLPEWVETISEADPDILFTDRVGNRRRDCLSFAVDELPVLAGKTPMAAFEEFFSGFLDAFGELIGTTVTDVSVGLGPGGELRYPSFPPTEAKGRNFTGVGEFQCYDKYSLAALKKHAEEAGNPLWGLSGPHDAPEYSQSPAAAGFFKDGGGSWESPYGDFFLSWYSGQLLAHGDRLLGLASKVFGHLPMTLSAKIPLLHCWHDTRSRPAQLAAGYYNSEGRDGYDSVAEMFARNSCRMVVPGVDLADRDVPVGLRSSPESLLSQIAEACGRHGVRMAGENSRLGGSDLGRARENLSMLDSYTHQRMGADFFSPEHWPLFREFVRSTTEPELDRDDLVSRQERLSMAGKDREMQAV
ncbi:inactive beta-amylase 9 [Iris pallida]|uniref:Beta-amylase n=1 Tax=Iris pallida TaxID=29817 RepID=A0AAX6HBM9_IRIPA|nr:inactive beta-amylase 9 [Iris pallida]